MWVNILNKALEQAGLQVRVDARSWAEQGREDLSALREPKLLTGRGPTTAETQAQVNQLRWQREKLPAINLNYAAALQLITEEGERAVEDVEQRRAFQLVVVKRLLKEARAREVD